jgi:hypothetical protein
MVELHKKRAKHIVQHVTSHPIPWETSHSEQIFDRDKFIWLLKKLQEEQHTSARMVRLVMDSQYISVYKQPVPARIKENEIRSWLEKNVIPKLTKEKVIFDYFSLRSKKRDQRKVMLFITTKKLIDSLEDIFAWAGLELASVQFSSLSLFEWLQYTRRDLPFAFSTFRFTANGVELSWFRDSQLEGMKYLSLPLISFCNQGGYSYSDWYRPILTTPSELVAFGEVLLNRVDQEMESWFQEFHWLPDEWILTGEGIDLYLLRNWLLGQIPAKISVDTIPEYFISPKLQKIPTGRFGASLSVLIGSLLNGGKA